MSEQTQREQTKCVHGSANDIHRRFTHHPPHGDQVERYQALREKGKALAFDIKAMVPDSREQSVALTKLEECIMWANAGIARNEAEGG